MRRKPTDNLGLKIISLIIGVFIWLVVVNIDDPVITRSFTLSNIELINEAYIDDTGLVCLKDGFETQVRVTISGNSKSLKGITVDDIRAIADLQQAVDLHTTPVMIPITVTCDGVNSANIEVTPRNVSVTLEDKVTSEFMIAVMSSGKVGKGYEIGTQTVSPEKVRITGPDSLMNKIDKVCVYPDVDGITEDQTGSYSLVVMDKNGDELTDVSMSNLKFDNEGMAAVTTTLWKTRSDVALETSILGEPEEGYIVDEVTTVPATISVAGTSQALEELQTNNNTIAITDGIDVSGASEDIEARVNLSDILPEGLKLTSGSSEEVLVTVSILPDGGKTFYLSTSEIKVNGIPEGMQLSFEVDKIELRVKADAAAEIDDFDLSKVKASLDLEDKTEGSYNAVVNLELPEGYELISEVTTDILISEVSTIESETE